jgi:HK97 family phage major capsid protein
MPRKGLTIVATTRERLEKAVADVQTFADELDKKDALSGEDVAALKARMQEVDDLKAQVTAEAEAKGQMADAKAFLKQLGGGEVADHERETITVDGLPMNPQGKTLGEMFTESPAYSDFVGKYAPNGVGIPNSTKGIQSGTFKTNTKALLTGASATSAGAAVRNDLYAPITDLVGERELTVVDLVTKGSTTSDTVEYVRVTTKTNSAAPTAEATSAAFATQDGTTGALIPTVGGGYKPESVMALEIVSVTVKTIAHWIPLTKRAAADAPQVRTLIDSFLRYGLDEELEDQILSGSGSGENFTGILNSSPQTVGSAGTDIDAVVDAIQAVRVTGKRKPNALVINPADWFSTGFLTAKDSQNRYLIGDPRASIDQLNTLWGLQVVVSEGLAANTALVGDFRQAVLWEREGVSVMVSDQHSDFFTRNLLAILAERRAAFGVLDPQAFCTITAV